MILSAASLRMEETAHQFDRPVIFTEDRKLYVSCAEATDRHVRAYPVPLYAVSFSDEKQDEVLRGRVINFVYRSLNLMSATQRMDITGTRGHVKELSVDAFLKEGMLFASNPCKNGHLQLYIVPVPVSRLRKIEVYKLGPIRCLGTIRKLSPGDIED